MTTTHPTLSRLRRNRKALLSVVALALITLAAVAGPYLWTLSPAQGNYSSTLAFPSVAHPLGTDSLGRDTLARLLAGLRVTLAVALIVELINVVLGVTVGLAAGYYGGAVDQFLSRLTDLLFAFPGILFAILIAGVFGPAVSQAYGGAGRLMLTAGALALISWPLMARYVRGTVLTLKARDFVEASRALGASSTYIIWRVLLRNLVGVVIVTATLDLANVIISEATLSLLGLGIQPPGSSLGLMINDAKSYLSTNFTQTLFPGLVIIVLVLLVSFLGDALRDVFDPKSRT